MLKRKNRQILDLSDKNLLCDFIQLWIRFIFSDIIVGIKC